MKERFFEHLADVIIRVLHFARSVRGQVRVRFQEFTRLIPHISGVTAAMLLFVSGWLYFGVAQPPAFFPLNTIVTIPEGVSLQQAATILKNAQVVRSALAFRLLVSVNDGHDKVLAGDYLFEEPATLSEVVQRITHGEFGLTPVRVMLPEGATTYRMSELLEKKLLKFDPVAFSLLTKDKEGYLYPDTYFFLPNVSASDVATELERTFYEKLQTIEDKVATFGKPIHEIVTMASLLEKEARDFEERRQIAGVLWHRLDIGMPLQVDAVFGFIQRTDTFSPKYSDLAVESPYNTYQNKGLPPGPIGSPSIAAIEAAVTPEETDALFYLHGRDGKLHLAKTYNEHLANIRRYLD